MSLPGFNAEVALYCPTNRYRGTYAAGFSSGVVPAAYLPGFHSCFLPCMRYYLPLGSNFSSADVNSAITTCSIACGMLESAARAALRASLGVGAGFFSAEAFGLTGGAALGAGALALLGIAFAVHDLHKGLSGPTQPPSRRLQRVL
jgi:hypothetical protein